jgi:hypothetical protein
MSSSWRKASVGLAASFAYRTTTIRCVALCTLLRKV